MKQSIESGYMRQANNPSQDYIQRSPIAKPQPEAQDYNRQQNALFDITAPTKKDNLSALYSKARNNC
jgi:hypothetical protein